jgi:selenide,water dikinase
LLVGLDHTDDAGVYRLNDETALVVTTDFFPPIVDDPGDFGRIAAANALSDVYAMGGKPLLALNLVCFPSKELPADLLRAILAGAREVCQEAGALVLGGHSVDDPELKFGLSVVGLVHPKEVTAVTGISDGQDLILTKPLGSGLVTTALKKGKATPEQVAATTRNMVSLNKPGGTVLQELGLRTATDITGFGLLGHLKHLLDEGAVGITLRAHQFPALPGALDFARAGILTGGAKRNLAYVQDVLDQDPELPEEALQLALDPQTSGGILMACPRNQTKEALERLAQEGALAATVIGETQVTSPGRIQLKP